MAKHQLNNALVKRVCRDLRDGGLSDITLDGVLAVLRRHEVYRPRDKLSELLGEIYDIDPGLSLFIGRLCAQEYRYLHDKLATIRNAFGSLGLVSRCELLDTAFKEDA